MDDFTEVIWKGGLEDESPGVSFTVDGLLESLAFDEPSSALSAGTGGT